MKSERFLSVLRWLMLIPFDQTKKLPDLTQVPEYINENIIEVNYSPKNNYRAVITQNTARGVYYVRRERWDISDFEYKHEGFWDEAGDSSITDSIEIARQLAQEKIKGL